MCNLTFRRRYNSQFAPFDAAAREQYKLDSARMYREEGKRQNRLDAARGWGLGPGPAAQFFVPVGG